MSKDGKTFLSLDNTDVKQKMAEDINRDKNLGLTPVEIQAFVKASFFGSSMGQLSSFLKIPSDKLTGNSVPGIPVVDSTNNELIDWIKYVVAAHSSTNTKLNLVLKGDNLSKYPQFKNVITAFKKNDQFKFQMVTNPEGVPTGTDLWRKYMKGETSGS